MNFHLIIFTRYPLPGLTKTRLIPALGEQGAADLQRAMTEHTVNAVRPLVDEGISIVVRYEGGGPRSMARWLGEDLSYQPQGEGDLGRRMERAFRDSADLGAEKTVIIGTDCPDLTAPDIREAFNLLGTNRVVLGPAADGGYYLIGVRTGAPGRLYDTLFMNIPWGTASVFPDTVNALSAAGIELGVLDEKDDVDEPEDLVHWQRMVRSQEPGAGSRVKEQNKFRTRAVIPSTASISVIIPTLNEEENIGRAIERLKKSHVEIIVADGGSTDATADICRAAGVKFVMTDSGRAVQMNSGAREASGHVLVFLHADTLLPDRFEVLVRDAIAGGAIAGAFSFGTDQKTFSMQIIEKGANARARFMGIVFGDQAIFARSDIFRRIGGFADLPVMEDMELVRKLKRQGRFVILDSRAVSSSRRWRNNGVWRTTLTNQAVMWLYLVGVNPDKLVKWYKEKLKVKG